MKKTSIFLLSIVFLLFLSSCGLNERVALDDDLHNVIECDYSNKTPQQISYQKEKYLYTNLFVVDDMSNTNNDADILLSWDGMRLGYINSYYSDTSESPIFIYEKRLDNLYLNEKFDYMSEVFVFENQQTEIIFSEMFENYSKVQNSKYEGETVLKAYSKKHNRIYIEMQIYSANGKYYISFTNTNETWICSNYFIELLKQNNMI